MILIIALCLFANILLLFINVMFFLNKKNLVQEIDDFVAELENLKQKIADEDEEGIKKLFIQSTERRKQFDK